MQLCYCMVVTVFRPCARPAGAQPPEAVAAAEVPDALGLFGDERRVVELYQRCRWGRQYNLI